MSRQIEFSQIKQKKILVVFAQIEFRVRDTLTLKKKREKISSNSNASNSSEYFCLVKISSNQTKSKQI